MNKKGIIAQSDRQLCENIINELRQKENEVVLLWKTIDGVRKKYQDADGRNAIDDFIRELRTRRCYGEMGRSASLGEKVVV